MVDCANLSARIVHITFWFAISGLFIWDSIILIKSQKSSTTCAYILISFYILFSAMFIWSYIVTCWSDPGSIKKFYKKIGIYQQIINGIIPPPLDSLPICKKCHLPKPERCHHCSICNRCHFRFDHHCPFIGNCICLYNFKAFMLMPFYAAIVLQIFGIELAVHYDFLIGIVFLLFPLVMWGFSFSYFQVIKENQTTLEGLMNPPGPSYDVGTKENFSEFLQSPFMAIFPTRPSITGFHWCKNDVEARLLEYVNNPSSFKENLINNSNLLPENSQDSIHETKDGNP